MEELIIPDWAKRARAVYDRDPVKWMWIGMTTLVVLLIAAMIVYIVSNQKSEASQLLSEGLLALSNGNYPVAVQSFERIQSSYRLSGFRDEAMFFSASAQFGLEQYESAEATFRKFLETNPEPEFAVKAELGVGACQEMRNDLPGALATYRAALARHPGSPFIKALEIRVARLSRETGDATAAAEIYDRLESDTEGLWREIARGNRRLVLVRSSSDTAAPSSAVPAAPAAAGEPR